MPLTPVFDKNISIKYRSKTFRVRRPLTDAEFAQGYKGVKSIAHDECMMFFYKEASPKHFTMNGCLVPLRMVFCASRGNRFRILQISDAQLGQDVVECDDSRCDCVFEFAQKTAPALLLGDNLTLFPSEK